MNCPKCNYPLEADDLFCPECGAKLNAAPVPPPAPAPAEKPPTPAAKPKKKPAPKKILAIVLAAMFVLSGAAAVIADYANRPYYEKALDHYFKALERKDAGVIYDMTIACARGEMLTKELGHFNGAVQLEDFQSYQDAIEDELNDLDDYIESCYGIEPAKKLKFRYEIEAVKTPSSRSIDEEMALAEELAKDFGLPSYCLEHVYKLKLKISVKDANGDWEELERHLELYLAYGIIYPIAKNDQYFFPGGDPFAISQRLH